MSSGRIFRCPRCNRGDLTTYFTSGRETRGARAEELGDGTVKGYRCADCGQVKLGDKRESVTSALRALDAVTTAPVASSGRKVSR